MGQAFLMNQKKVAKAYQRPNKWLPIPAFDSNKDEIYVLMAVYETDFNPIAFTMEGAYSVDWGDGSAVENFASGATASHIIDWADISSDTYFSERGYRQALIHIYANRGTITNINFDAKHSLASVDTSSGILEINGNVNSYNTLLLAGNNVYHQMMEIFSMAGISNVTDMSYTFAYCNSLQSIPLLDTSSVTDMSYTFAYCNSLQSIPLLDTSSVTDMSYTFAGCNSLQSIPLLDTSSVTDMSHTFEDCYSLQSIPLLDTSSVTDMSYTFAYCNSLQSIPLLDTSSVTDMSYTFAYCYSLQSIPLLDTSSVTDMSHTFEDCYSLRNLNFVQNSPKISFSIANCQLSATELNTIFGQLATVSGQTITITGNPGADTCDRTIATNKGWTVEG